jgi:hypothetical protein
MPLHLSVEQRGVTAELPPSVQLVFLGFGAMIQAALVLAAEVGVADHLADGPRTAEELSRSTSSHGRSLYRVLRLLSSFGVFSGIEPGRFAQTPLSEYLRTGTPGSLRSWLRMLGMRPVLNAWAESEHTLKTGKPAFALANGAEFFDYFVTHREEGELFNAAMNDFGQVTASAVVAAYDFSTVRKLVDVGGGHGTLIRAILQANPGMSGILFDLPHVVEGARTAIESAGLVDRCEITGGDFFRSVPAGADAYALRWIIHDWDHERAITLLKNCRAAMKPTARLLLVEAVLPPGDEPHPSKVLDFAMLAAMGGEERTEAEYVDLLGEAGFRLNRVVPTASPLSIIEGVVA